MNVVRTVLGDIPPEELGICDAHDHLFLRTPALPGQELDDAAAALVEVQRYAALGGQSIVQWTPHGMGRQWDRLVEISRATGVHIVAATGLHQARHYASLEDIWDRLADVFIAELSWAGMIKVAGDFHGLGDHARHTMAAAAQAHRATGAPIGVHLEGGTGGHEVLDLLCGRLEVPVDRVILGHLNRTPDMRMHRDLARSGAFLAFDGPSEANHATDWRLFDCLAALIEAGHAEQLLLGGDTTTAAARSRPGMSYLIRELQPRLEREFGLAAQIFIGNPAMAFAADWLISAK
ncbi:phosphotriesterase family protein [Kibdelosporangium aridum]|uniref:Phosphotriesterase-related protein n=1 Tax=Kibdelosporangium aridum TaxID=2030 RepID=A0A1Y5X5T3_KIBAR|nr:phosphotriesterase [Kibdelosporangium aridum]SMC72800.1 phosphotriesterase-related protein [Kibdelosporangium aridum]